MHDKGLDEFTLRTIMSASRRNFIIKFLIFENGCFISISESSDRIGSISVSMSSSNTVNTAKVIPSKFNPVFVNTISERISFMINGICITSLHSLTQLEFDDMKEIMDQIMNLAGDKYKENGNRRKQKK
jgi:hypothetical protein